MGWYLRKKFKNKYLSLNTKVKPTTQVNVDMIDAEGEKVKEK